MPDETKNPRPATDEIERFHAGLLTLPGLVQQLASAIAQSQTALDRNYVDNMTRFLFEINPLLEQLAPAEGADAGKTSRLDAMKELLKIVAPSRYQFSETIIEVRADLQSSASKSVDVSGGMSLNAGPFAVTVNASYSKRHSYDYRAAALVRTTLHAIPADSSLLNTLLARGGTDIHAKLPEPNAKKDAENASLIEAVKELATLNGEAGKAEKAEADETKT